MQDALRPSKAETQRLLEESAYMWESYMNAANNREGLSFDSVNPVAMLGDVPAFLGVHSPRETSVRELEYSKCDTIGELWATGKSTWRTTTGKCNLPKKVLSQKLLLGISSRIPCAFTEEDRFRNWPGIEKVERSAEGNFIAVLMLAWCYIFSARWIEIQSSCSPGGQEVLNLEQLEYLNNRACWSTIAESGFHEHISVDLGELSGGARRWWASILASGEGWQASIVRLGRRYFSPWSTSLLAQQRFVLDGPSKEFSFDTAAPSSTTALQYLSDFCDLHCIHGQSFAALAATMLVPYHAGAGRLLLPKPYPWLAPIRPTSTCLHKIREVGDILPYYMSLSCNTGGVRSLLHGAFFEPSVPCNLVSAWLYGTFKTIDVLSRKKSYLKLAVVMAERQPKLAALWLGAILLGMENHIIQPVRAGMFAVDVLTAAWTCTTHSFIGPGPPIPSRENSATISRSDEARLLYLVEADGHTRAPVCPWEPFGCTILSETDVEIREHTSCGGNHCFQYESWAWDLQGGGQTDADKGFLANKGLSNISLYPTKSTPHLEMPQRRVDSLEVSEDLSANATRSIFGWLRPAGYPYREREIWTHPWFKIVDEDEDEEDEYEESAGGESTDSSGPKSKTGHNVAEWLSNSQSPTRS